MFKRMILLTAVLTLALLALVSCQKGAETATAPAADATLAQNLPSVQVVPVDETFMLVSQAYPAEKLAAGLVTDPVIGGKDGDGTAFQIGVRAAHALLAAVLGDMDAAGRIAESIKLAAESLNVKSDRIEACLATARKDLANPDEKTRRRLVRLDINQLVDTVIATLNKVDNRRQALLIELGLWSEGLRLAAELVAADYRPDVSALFARKAEVEYYQARLAALGGADLAQGGHLLQAVSQPMEADPSTGAVAVDKIKAILAAAAAFQAPYAGK